MSKSLLRNVIGEYMTVLGRKNSKVILINADLAGTCRNRGFGENYPERTFNVGIAEQNMISFATGMAREGFLPYVFSMAPFLSMRACEQVRTDIAYGKQNVRMIGVYAGVSGGISGATHWGLEDVGIMTAIPGITIMEVSDGNQAKRMLENTLLHDGPVYIRCGVEPTEDIYEENVAVNVGGANTVVQGEDGAILCSGVIVQYAVEAAEVLKRELGVAIRVVDMYSIKPINREAIIDAARTGRVIVAQDHNVIGGLGSMVAQVIVEEGFSTKFHIAGITDRFEPMAHAPYLYEKFEMDGKGLTRIMKGMLECNG